MKKALSPAQVKAPKQESFPSQIWPFPKSNNSTKKCVLALNQNPTPSSQDEVVIKCLAKMSGESFKNININSQKKSTRTSLDTHAPLIYSITAQTFASFKNS